MSVHPAHLTDSQGTPAPAALIPFCAYQTRLLGQPRPGLPFTACDRFRPAVLEGHLCYSLQLGLDKNSRTKEGLDNGILLLIDHGRTNREIIEETHFEVGQKIDSLNLRPVSDQESSARIYVNTLASFSGHKSGSYAMSNLKQMTGTESFKELSDDIKECQVEPMEECQAKAFLENVQKECGCVPWVFSSFLVEVKLFVFANLTIRASLAPLDTPFPVILVKGPKGPSEPLKKPADRQAIF